jgi:hypothetical protein
MTKQEYEAKVLSLKGTHDYNMLCFIRGEYIASLEAEVAQLQADNRSLVEQANQMALKPNQAIIERHEYDHDNPETYPPKRRSYLCETISGFVELFWNPIGQEWHIATGMNDIYNHFQINAYYTWVYPPQRSSS